METIVNEVKTYFTIEQRSAGGTRASTGQFKTAEDAQRAIDEDAHGFFSSDVWDEVWVAEVTDTWTVTKRRVT